MRLVCLLGTGGLILLGATGCLRRVAGPLEALDDAQRAVAAGSVDARAVALAGFRSLLVDGDEASAQARFDEALAQRRPGDPWALYGQSLLATHHAHPERALAAALELLQLPRTHPLKVVAARLALELAGQAEAFDEALRRSAPAILATPMPADAAHLFRAALVAAQPEATEGATREGLLADMGVMTAATLVGPFSAWHRLATADVTPVERSGSLEDLGAGPFGPLRPRALHFADGRFTLSGEPPTGDSYVLAADVRVEEAGDFVLRTITAMDHVAVVDGTSIIERATWQRPAPTLSAQALHLSRGTHRLVLRLVRATQAGNLTVALHRRDGAPARLTFVPASGRAPSWHGVGGASNEGLYPSVTSLRVALEPEAGRALAGFVAARDGLGRDADGAAVALAALSELQTPAVALLRAALALHHGPVPPRVARGRATRELEAALARAPRFVEAQLTLARLALEDDRPFDALEQVRAARAMDENPGAPVHALEARVELALGLDAAAAATAARARALTDGYCDAVLLQYDVARRRDAVAAADALLGEAAHCSGALARAAEHHRARGHIEAAVDAYATLLRQDETQQAVARSLAGLLTARRRFDEAAALLRQQQALWPRNAAVLKALADVEEQAQRPASALAAREAALAIDGGDLPLRRQVERARTGRELLEEEAIATDDAVATYEAAPGSEDASSAFVLDFAAVRAYPDGSIVERIHVIQKALDQQGVQDIAEVQIPQDAAVLALRTLKADGRRLEPESIEGKDAASLPNVEVGDMVEYEYLLAHPARGPGQPGFTASNFYFQIARQPNSRSTYIVKAPKGSGLKVDAHHVRAPAVTVEGDLEVFRHEERKVPPYIPEPGGPPSGNEWLPFVAVGAGQEGDEGLLRTYADTTLEQGLITSEVERFAREAAGAATGLDAIRAVYAAVMEKLTGRDAGLAVSAAASVAQDRGSRTWLLAAALRALGLEARLAIVRTFTADPNPYLFPSEGLYGYVCIVVRLADGRLLWLDPMVRFAPFGELPEFATGGRPAWLLPEPGRPAERLQSPPSRGAVTKDVRLTMALDTNGTLRGDGVEVTSGFDAAQLGEALEALSADQRDQALQAALSRYFGGADLSALRVDAPRRVGATVTVSYHFEAAHFARQEGSRRLVAGALTFPHLLGRRYLLTPSRVTPLFIESSEDARVVATLTLPHDFKLVEPLGRVERSGPSARFVRTERQEQGQVFITEEFRLAQSRVAPDAYEAFSQFAGEVDLLQEREVVFECEDRPTAQ